MTKRRINRFVPPTVCVIDTRHLRACRARLSFVSPSSSLQNFQQWFILHHQMWTVAFPAHERKSSAVGEAAITTPKESGVERREKKRRERYDPTCLLQRGSLSLSFTIDTYFIFFSSSTCLGCCFCFPFSPTQDEGHVNCISSYWVESWFWLLLLSVWLAGWLAGELFAAANARPIGRPIGRKTANSFGREQSV